MKKPQYTIGELEGEDDPYKMFAASSPDIKYKDPITVEADFYDPKKPIENLRNAFGPSEKVETPPTAIFDGQGKSLPEYEPSQEEQIPTAPVQTPTEPVQIPTAQPPALTPKSTDTSPDKDGFDWMSVIGRLASGVTPMALEALFGGSKKYYGSAARGGLGGLKMYNDLEQQQWTREHQMRQYQAEKGKLSKEANKFDLKPVKDAQGNDRLANFNEKTGQWELTELSPYDKPSTSKAWGSPFNARLKDPKTGQISKETYRINMLTYPDGTTKEIWNGQDVTGLTVLPDKVDYGSTAAANLDLRKKIFEAGQRKTLEANIEKLLDMAYDLKRYNEMPNALESFTPKWAKTPDSNLPSELREGRQVVRSIFLTKLREAAGTATTESEYRNNLVKYGLSGVRVSWSEALTSPERGLDMWLNETDPSLLKKVLDRDTYVTQMKLKAAQESVLPDVANKFYKDVGIPSLKPNASPQTGVQTAPKETTTSTTSQAKSLLESYKSKRGLK